jgi:hypothetical protein
MVGQVVGTALAGRTVRVGARGMATMVALGGDGLLSNAMVVAEARLQDAVTGPARATVTSVHGFGAEVVAVLCFAALAVATGWVSVALGVAALGLPVLAVAGHLSRTFPDPAREDSSVDPTQG